MGVLSFFNKTAPTLFRLPSGSFTVNRKGEVVSTTLPSGFPQEIVVLIANRILAGFQNAAASRMPLSELVINYPSLRITARDMHGGAVIFLSPKTQSLANNSKK